MPRKADNNPTERIGRLLMEMAELVSLVQKECPDKLPRLPAFESEKTRRSLTYTRNINRTRQRHAMNNSMEKPYRVAVAHEKQFHEDAMREAELMTQGEAGDRAQSIEPLSLEDIELALAADRKREAQEIIERGKNANTRIGDTYKPDVKNLFSKTKVEE